MNMLNGKWKWTKLETKERHLTTTKIHCVNCVLEFDSLLDVENQLTDFPQGIDFEHNNVEFLYKDYFFNLKKTKNLSNLSYLSRYLHWLIN